MVYDHVWRTTHGGAATHNAMANSVAPDGDTHAAVVLAAVFFATRADDTCDRSSELIALSRVFFLRRFVGVFDYEGTVAAHRNQPTNAKQASANEWDVLHTNTHTPSC